MELAEGYSVKKTKENDRRIKCVISERVSFKQMIEAVIAANAVVTKDVPVYSVAAGNPAKIFK